MVDLITPFDHQSYDDPVNKLAASKNVQPNVQFKETSKTSKEKNTVAQSAYWDEVVALERMVLGISTTNKLKRVSKHPYESNYETSPEYPDGPDRNDSLECTCWIDEDKRNKIIEKICSGLQVESAVITSRVSTFAFKYWITRANRAVAQFYNINRTSKQDKKYLEFITEINEAIENSKEIMVRTIHAHGYRDWKAHAWLLERKFPKEYGRPTQMVVVGNLSTTEDVKTTKTVSNDLEGYREHFKNMDVIDVEQKQIEASNE